MILHFLRHSQAEPSQSQNHHFDRERVLTQEGQKTMQLAAQGFKKMGVSFERIISSPYPRAMQTAQIVSDVYGYQREIIQTENLIPEALFHKFRKELLTSWTHFKSVLIVTHQPFVSECLSCFLTGKDVPIAVDMGTGTLCSLEIDASLKGPAILSAMIRADTAMLLG